MSNLFNPNIDKIPSDIRYLITDIDGVLTTDDKKSIAPGIYERLSDIKSNGVIVIANTLRGITKYSNIINGKIQDVVDFGISERGAIQIDKNKNIIPLLEPQDIEAINMFDKQIKDLLIGHGAQPGPGPYTCVRYYFADNQTCQDIIKQMENEPLYANRNNDLVLEVTGQGSLVLTKKGIDKGYGTVKSIGQENLSKTVVIGDDQVDESMFLLPGTHSFNVGTDIKLNSSYITSKIGHKATIEILDALIEALNFYLKS